MSRHGDIENLLKRMPNRRDLAHALLMREEELKRAMAVVEAAQEYHDLLVVHADFVPQQKGFLKLRSALAALASEQKP
jgi:hypothetical protein